MLARIASTSPMTKFAAALICANFAVFFTPASVNKSLRFVLILLSAVIAVCAPVLPGTTVDPCTTVEIVARSLCTTVTALDTCGAMDGSAKVTMVFTSGAVKAITL